MTTLFIFKPVETGTACHITNSDRLLEAACRIINKAPGLN
jgi:hypothetical protein